MPRSRRCIGERIPARTRGRPSLDQAAQIDLEVLLAARELFFTHGYERTSMAMIIKTAGVSKTTLYTRYANKADLFKATVVYTLDHIGSKSMTTERRTDDLQLGLAHHGNDLLKVAFSELWLSYERLVYAEGVKFPELIDGIGTRVEFVIRNVAAFIRECAERDGVPCKDPDGIATIYVMAVRGYYTAAVLSTKVPDSSQSRGYVDTLVGTLLAGRHAW
jgi:TetR/AcrR family transcriptional repressor of mexJK operon